MEKAIIATLTNGFTFLVDFGSESKVKDWVKYYGDIAVEVKARNMNKRFSSIKMKYDYKSYDMFGALNFTDLNMKEKLSVVEIVEEV